MSCTETAAVHISAGLHRWWDTKLYYYELDRKPRLASLQLATTTHPHTTLAATTPPTSPVLSPHGSTTASALEEMIRGTINRRAAMSPHPSPPPPQPAQGSPRRPPLLRARSAKSNLIAVRQEVPVPPGLRDNPIYSSPKSIFRRSYPPVQTKPSKRADDWLGDLVPAPSQPSPLHGRIRSATVPVSKETRLPHSPHSPPIAVWRPPLKQNWSETALPHGEPASAALTCKET